MLGIEDEGLIKGLDIATVGGWGAFLITEDHPEEVLRKALLAGGLDIAFTAAAPDIKSDDGGNLGHKLQRSTTDMFRVFGVFLRVLGTDIGNGGTQDVHWVARQRHGHNEVNDMALQVAQGLLAGGESDKRFLTWQFAVPQQVGHFLKGAVASQLLDGITAIGQRIGLGNDLRNGSLIDDDAV